MKGGGRRVQLPVTTRIVFKVDPGRGTALLGSPGSLHDGPGRPEPPLLSFVPHHRRCLASCGDGRYGPAMPAHGADLVHAP